MRKTLSPSITLKGYIKNCTGKTMERICIAKTNLYGKNNIGFTQRFYRNQQVKLLRVATNTRVTHENLSTRVQKGSISMECRAKNFSFSLLVALLGSSSQIGNHLKMCAKPQTGKFGHETLFFQ